MAKKTTTTTDRTENEEALAAAVCSMIAASTEIEVAYWSLETSRLRNLLGAAAIRRAERRGGELAEARAPGWIAASEAIDTFDRVVKRARLTRTEQDSAWNAICQIAMFQLGAGAGPFYDHAVKVGLIDGRVGEVIRREMSRPRPRVAPEDAN
jgi:hypothetical protein